MDFTDLTSVVEMDEVGQRDHRRRRMINHIDQWNMISMYQIKETSDFHMNAKIAILCDERDAATEERDKALVEKKLALNERDVAIQQRNAAIAERDKALRERDNAIAALQFQESTMNAILRDGASGLKRMTHTKNHRSNNMQSTHSSMEMCMNDATSVTAIPTEVTESDQVKRTKGNKDATGKLSKLSKKVKRISNNMNSHVTKDGSRADWGSQDFTSLNQIHFDKSTMPVPICSCTGVSRQCYKWGHGGWQSSCCTTSLSVYPLPQLPNKKHARMGGRKMSASVYSRLLTRLTAAGHDLLIPLDLKNYWAKHGTNRYNTIK